MSDDFPPPGMPMPFFGGPSVHVLRIELLDVEPAVWRRLVVPSEVTLPEFNRMLEVTMGWAGYHLHLFDVAGLRFGPLDEDDDVMIDERQLAVRQVLPRVGAGLRWEYDFGDGWEHDVVVESIAAPSADMPAPDCLGGERACPPEDCGGAPGYEHLLEVLADPNDPEHADLREWAGDFEADEFDRAATAAELRRVRDGHR